MVKNKQAAIAGTTEVQPGRQLGTQPKNKGALIPAGLTVGLFHYDSARRAECYYGTVLHKAYP